MGNIINKQNIFFFGYGYVAQYFSRSFVHEYNHKGYSFHQTKPKYLAAPRMSVAFDFSMISAEILDLYDFFLISIPPNYSQKSDVVIEKFYDYFLTRNKPFKLIYLSATSVYGDHDGKKVHEDSALLAKSENGLARIACESKYNELKSNKYSNIIILRLAGIYGDQRNAIEGIKSQRITCNYQSSKIISRTHVNDIINIINIIFVSDIENTILNVADDGPCSTKDLNDYVCTDILFIPILELKEQRKEFRHSSFALDNKVIDNSKLKALLNYKFIYQTYKEGLAAIAKSIKEGIS